MALKLTKHMFWRSNILFLSTLKNVILFFLETFCSHLCNDGNQRYAQIPLLQAEFGHEPNDEAQITYFIM